MARPPVLRGMGQVSAHGILGAKRGTQTIPLTFVFAERKIAASMNSPLRKIRLKKRLTLAAVSAAVGTDAGNLSRLERRTQVAGPDIAARLSRFFGGAISELEIIYPERYPRDDERRVATRRQGAA